MNIWVDRVFSVSAMLHLAAVFHPVEFGLGLLAGISAAVYVGDRLLSRRLGQLSQQVRSASDASASADAPAQSAIGQLEALQSAVGNLVGDRDQIAQALAQVTAIKHRMEKELQLGRNIQMNLLTLTLPNFPKRKDLELDAILQPARELGGDFYDFYFFREQSSYLFEQNTFCFCIGDISGKGVPAALFMAVVKTLIRAQADISLSPSKILTQVNQAISLDNPDMMFATLCFCTLNLTTGVLNYTNAGHNPPYIRRHDGSVEKLEIGHGPPVGIVEDITYREARTTLNYGDLIFSYTDGVTEAMDAQETLFSDDRLAMLIRTGEYRTATEVIRLVRQAVADFQGRAEQADDITMLALQFLGHPEAIEQSSEFVIRDEILSSLRQDWQ